MDQWRNQLGLSCQNDGTLDRGCLTEDAFFAFVEDLIAAAGANSM